MHCSKSIPKVRYTTDKFGHINSWQKIPTLIEITSPSKLVFQNKQMNKPLLPDPADIPDKK